MAGAPEENIAGKALSMENDHSPDGIGASEDGQTQNAELQIILDKVSRHLDDMNALNSLAKKAFPEEEKSSENQYDSPLSLQSSEDELQKIKQQYESENPLVEDQTSLYDDNEEQPSEQSHSPKNTKLVLSVKADTSSSLAPQNPPIQEDEFEEEREQLVEEAPVNEALASPLKLLREGLDSPLGEEEINQKIQKALSDNELNFSRQLEETLSSTSEKQLNLENKLDDLTTKLLALEGVIPSLELIDEFRMELDQSREMAESMNLRVEQIDSQIETLVNEQQGLDEHIIEMAQKAALDICEKLDFSQYDQKFETIETMLNSLQEQRQNEKGVTDKKFDDLKNVLSEMSQIMRTSEERSVQTIEAIKNLNHQMPSIQSLIHQTTEQRPLRQTDNTLEDKAPVVQQDDQIEPAETVNKQKRLLGMFKRNSDNLENQEPKEQQVEAKPDLEPAPTEYRPSNIQAQLEILEAAKNKQIVINAPTRKSKSSPPSNIRAQWQERRKNDGGQYDGVERRGIVGKVNQLKKNMKAVSLIALIAGGGLMLNKQGSFNGVSAYIPGFSQKQAPSKKRTVKKKVDSSLQHKKTKPNLTKTTSTKPDVKTKQNSEQNKQATDVVSTQSILQRMKTNEDDQLITNSTVPANLAASTKINPSSDQKRNDRLTLSTADKPHMPPLEIGSYSLRINAKNGDKEAQYEVARRFSIGQGVPKNLERAVYWYHLSGQNGFAPAQYRLATMYERGDGVQKDRQEAKKWYKKAAENGNMKAMHNVAVLLSDGNNANPDYRAAAHWFRKAADKGLTDSQYNLAVLYYDGLGVEKDPSQAYFWFSLAAKSGDPDARAKRNSLGEKISISDRFEIDRLIKRWGLTHPTNTKKNAEGIERYQTKARKKRRKKVNLTPVDPQLQLVQKLLNKNGFSVGNTDGRMGGQTKAAIKNYELSRGWAATGQISPKLINALASH